jgi:hypothetical protein
LGTIFIRVHAQVTDNVESVIHAGEEAAVQQLPLIALHKRAHHKLPVSMVAIRGSGAVDTASHQGSINHYQYSRPADPCQVDGVLRARFGSAKAAGRQGAAMAQPACSDAPATGSSSGLIAASSAEQTVESQQLEAMCVGTEQAMQHDRQHEQIESRASEGLVRDTVNEFVSSLQQQQQEVARAERREHQAQPREQQEALALISVERVAPLDVLYDDAWLPRSPGGELERMLTGFQV